ncbi:hypothetical protein GCM10007387_05010 [Pseudoduganella albidiflava]|uniref:Uncharacterized protein n=1 Tax=Pseudoduganella albidiflava TaxID=321983 RepID=A0AA88BZ05_9BURK|nr:hypothetical protein GCM10007387_05010 [Pseudoduganella albidiflava]
MKWAPGGSLAGAVGVSKTASGKSIPGRPEVARVDAACAFVDWAAVGGAVVGDVVDWLRDGGVCAALDDPARLLPNSSLTVFRICLSQ